MEIFFVLALLCSCSSIVCNNYETFFIFCLRSVSRSWVSLAVVPLDQNISSSRSSVPVICSSSISCSDFMISNILYFLLLFHAFHFFLPKLLHNFISVEDIWGSFIFFKFIQQNSKFRQQNPLMADFYIQTDKQFYFAGDTVNGNIFINCGAVIQGATGVSMKFTGYECVKWVEATQLHRPRPPPRNHRGPPPYDPIAAIPRGQLHEASSNNIEISEVESEDDRSYDHRPKYIHTPNDRYFKMEYFETRNMFTKNKTMVYQTSTLVPGQYSFPFCFKTFEGWPASFSYKTPRKKGVIEYHMTVALEPMTKKFNFKYTQEITLRETRMLEAQHIKSEAEITSCCCCSKGNTLAEVHFEKDGYMPGQMVQMIIEIDNQYCSADIPTVDIAVTNVVGMRSNHNSTSDSRTMFSKSINGLRAGDKCTGNEAIRESFPLQSNQQLKPTCSGKLLSSQYNLSVTLRHDISCQCCSDQVGASIPVIIFPIVHMYQMPPVFQTNWAPQQMPMTNIALSNDFANFNLNQMQQGYPQQGYPPQQQGYPPQQQGYPPQQQGYPPQQYPTQNNPQEHQEETMMEMRG